MTHLAQPSHGLGPAEGFLDAFANALGDRIAGMPGSAAVDRRTAAVGILSDMRGDRLVAQLHHKLAGIVALIGTQRNRLRPVGMRFNQGQRRQALGMARSAGRHRANDQAVAVLHPRVAHENQPRLLAGSFAVETSVGVGGRDMRVILAALAVEVARTVAARAGRLARAVFWTEALGARPRLPP